MLREELWIADLSALSGVTLCTSEALHTAFVAQLSTRLGRGDTVEQGGVGQWRKVVEREFATRLPDNKRFLIPPRVYPALYQISAEATPDDELLVSALCKTADFPHPTVTAWYKSMAKLLQTAAREGKELHWKDIGRFTQEGDCRYFSPAGKLCNLLNKAFSAFSPTEMAENYNPTGIELRSANSLSEALQICIPISRSDSIPVSSSDATPLSIVDKQQKHETADPHSSATEAQVPEVPSEQSEETSPGTMPPPLPPTLHEAIISERTPPLPRIEEKPAQKIKVVSWLTAITLVLAALIATLIVVILYTGNKQKPCTTPVPAVPNRTCPGYIPETGALNESVEIPKNKQPKDSRTVSPQHETTASAPADKVSPANTVEHIRVKNGDRLTTLALKKYGNKVFWVYIYKENQACIDNPDVLKPGTTLTLPPAAKYAIDPNDTKSVQRALALRKTIQER